MSNAQANAIRTRLLESRQRAAARAEIRRALHVRRAARKGARA